MFVPRIVLLFSALLFSWSAAFAQDLVWDNGTFTPFGLDEMSRHVIANDFTIDSTQTISAVRFWSYETSDIVGLQTFFGSIYWAVYAHDPVLKQPGIMIASGLTSNLTRFVPPQPPNFGAFIQNDFAIGPLTLTPGTYWLALHNGPLRNAEASDMFWAISGVNRGLGRRAGDIVPDQVQWLPSAAEAPDNGFQLFGYAPDNLIYSSYGPGNTYCDTPGCRTWTFGSGAPGPQEVGFRFVAPRSSSFALETVTLSLSAAYSIAKQAAGGGRIAVSVNADENGVPGAPLETLFYSSDGVNLGQPVTVSLMSSSHPRLEAGGRYWVTAAAEPASRLLFSWQSNPSGITGPAATRSSNALWAVAPNATIGAFSVTGTPSTAVGLPPPPVSVSDRVTSTQSDWAGTRNLAGQPWSTVLTVTNTGVTNSRGDRMSAIEGPIQIVLTDLSPNARLINATGLTLEGWPYVTVTRDPLVAGASASATLEFSNLTGGSITFRVEVFSGVF